jgi:glycosyltransferase involved in cell wall biosynthesis
VRCLQSVGSAGYLLVYVDSGSTDGSVERAREAGAEVVCLDMKEPFTAARARNAGWHHALMKRPDTAFVQFVDGDCEVVSGWIATAKDFLIHNPQAAAACGRRRERYPEQSVYNRLCDLEWDTPVGKAKACGGDVLMRASAILAAGGYRDSLIAGEEPELCVRLRAAGWEIWRLDEEMTLHDAAMTRFSQWWRRTMRGGYAFAEGAHLHGAPPERHWVRESRSALLWGAIGPLAVATAVLSLGWKGLVLALIYPAQYLRLALNRPQREQARWIRALFLVIGKFPETIGVLRFHWQRLSQQPARLIEYKG